MLFTKGENRGGASCHRNRGAKSKNRRRPYRSRSAEFLHINLGWEEPSLTKAIPVTKNVIRRETTHKRSTFRGPQKVRGDLNRSINGQPILKGVYPDYQF